MAVSRPVALIIEDCLDMSQYYELVFEKGGYDLVCVYDGRHAYTLLHTLVPHLILIDLTLPGVQSADLINWINQQPHLVSTTTIVISSDGYAAEEIRPHVDFVFYKPVSLSHLKRVAKRLLPIQDPSPGTTGLLAIGDPAVPFRFQNVERELGKSGRSAL